MYILHSCSIIITHNPYFHPTYSISTVRQSSETLHLLTILVAVQDYHSTWCVILLKSKCYVRKRSTHSLHRVLTCEPSQFERVVQKEPTHIRIAHLSYRLGPSDCAEWRLCGNRDRDVKLLHQSNVILFCPSVVEEIPAVSLIPAVFHYKSCARRRWKHRTADVCFGCFSYSSVN